MLLSVEGGGFFSSSATGYSKGLTLLFLKNKEKPMRISPWNQYHLVEHKPEPAIDLDSANNKLSKRCASFGCFGQTPSGLETPSHIIVGPSDQEDILRATPASDTAKETTADLDIDSNSNEVALKSSLKRPSISSTRGSTEYCEEHEIICENDCISSHITERKKLQWTDTCGRELVEIREFEPRYYRYEISCTKRGRYRGWGEEAWTVRRI